MLNKAEMSKSLSMLRSKRNIKAERLIQQQFGITMWIPADMIASKQAPDFFWLSNNSPTVMKNIVVYRNWHRTTADGLLWYYDSPESFFVSARNYWLGRNIKGETDSMQMSTVNGALMDSPLLGKRQNDRWIFRGLWEMTGDDMGGPFVSLTLPMDSKQWKQKGDYGCDHIVIEGFVFAPGRRSATPCGSWRHCSIRLIRKTRNQIIKLNNSKIWTIGKYAWPSPTETPMA